MERKIKTEERLGRWEDGKFVPFNSRDNALSHHQKNPSRGFSLTTEINGSRLFWNGEDWVPGVENAKEYFDRNEYDQASKRSAQRGLELMTGKKRGKSRGTDAKNPSKSALKYLDKQIQLLKLQARDRFWRGVGAVARGAGNLARKSAQGWGNIIRETSNGIKSGQRAIGDAARSTAKRINKASKPLQDAYKDWSDYRQRRKEAELEARRKFERKESLKKIGIKRITRNSQPTKPTPKTPSSTQELIRQAQKQTKTETTVSEHTRDGNQVKRHIRKLTPQQERQAVAAQASKIARRQQSNKPNLPQANDL